MSASFSYHNVFEPDPKDHARDYTRKEEKDEPVTEHAVYDKFHGWSLLFIT